jgi:hypothetical protein
MGSRCFNLETGLMLQMPEQFQPMHGTSTRAGAVLVPGIARHEAARLARSRPEVDAERDAWIGVADLGMTTLGFLAKPRAV